MKTITGYLAVLLGAAGVLVTLALVGLVWWGAFQFGTQTEKATTQADQSLVQIEEGTDRLKAQLVPTVNSVEAVRAAAAKAAQRPNTPAARTEIGGLQANLDLFIERMDALREALPPIAQVIENLATIAEQGGSKARAERLRAIAGNAREAAKELGAVRDQSVTLRDRDSFATAQEVEALARQTRKPLDRITAVLSDVKQESASLRKELPEARRTLDEWKLTGAAVGTGVLLWVGVGQLAVVAWGRRRLADRAVATPRPTAGAK